MVLNILEMMMSYLTLWVIDGLSCKPDTCSYELTRIYTFTKGPDDRPNATRALLAAKPDYVWEDIESIKEVDSGILLSVDSYKGHESPLLRVCEKIVANAELESKIYKPIRYGRD